MAEPVAAVVVSTHDRALRLRWLLNALSQQTLPAPEFEVVVAHDSRRPDTEALLHSHPLRAAGTLRHLSFPPASMMPGAKREAAWRACRAPLVLFTDDDCRPPPDWVSSAVRLAQAHPGDIVQGATLPDPEEALILRGAPWAHTVLIEPPTPWAETCNIVYPRAVLERVGGFDAELRVGEDTDLAVRAQRAGSRLVAAPGLVVYHAVEDRGLIQAIRGAQRWSDMAELARRYPRLRLRMWGGLWWKREHAALTAALLALPLSRRRRGAAALALPWLALSMPHRGYRPRGLARSVSELPGRALIDLAEVIALARGSARHRTLLL